MNLGNNGFDDSAVAHSSGGSGKTATVVEDDDDMEIWLFIEATKLYETGIRKGILGTDIDEAEISFQNSKQMVIDFMNEEEHAASMKNNVRPLDIQIKWQELLVNILCQSSKLANLVRKETLSQRFASDGIEAHKGLLQLLSMQESSFKDDGDDVDCAKKEGRIQNDVLLARLYQEMAIAVSIQRSSSSTTTCVDEEMSPRFWTLKGLSLMKQQRNKLTMELLPLEAKMMTGVFFSYLGYDGLSQEEKLDGCTEALQIFESIFNEYRNSKSSSPSLRCYDFYSNYVQVLRVSAYVFRETNKMDKADQIVQGMKQICDMAMTRFPNSAIYLMAKYRCLVSQSDHYEGSTNNTTNELLSSRKREAEAGEQVCICLGNRTPTVYWSWVGNSFLRLAQIKAQDTDSDNQLHIKSAMESIQKAIKYYRMCVESYASNNEKIPFRQQFDYFGAVVEAGSIYGKVDGKVWDSMNAYSKSFTMFITAGVICREECNDGHKEYCIWALSNAVDRCIKENDATNNMLKQLLQHLFDVGDTLESRKSIVHYSSILKDIGTKLMEKHFLTDAMDVFKRILEYLNTLRDLYPWHTRISYYIGQAYLGLSETHEKMDNIEHEVECRRGFLRIQSALHGSKYDQFFNDYPEDEDVQLYVELLRSECQTSPEILKLSVPCHPIGSDPSLSSSSNVYVYVTEAIPGKDPIDDELRVLREDHDGVTITDGIEDSIRTLHRLAVKNKVSFLQLFRYALGPDEADNANRKKKEILKTPFPRGYYNKNVWSKRLAEVHDSNTVLQTRAAKLLVHSMYNVIEIYGDFPDVVYNALGQVIDPLFEKEEYTEEIVQVLVDAGKEENRPLLVKYGQSLQILRNLCFKDDDLFATQFSDDEMDALGGKEVYFNRISNLTIDHIKEIRQQIADRTEVHPKYLYERPIPPAVLSKVCSSSVDMEGYKDETAELKKEVECCICSESIDVAEVGSYMLAPCDHLFHRTCLSQWMSIKMDCPLCRANLP